MQAIFQNLNFRLIEFKRKSNFLKRLFLISNLFLSFSFFSQTLSVGDIAIIGHNCDPNTSVSKTFAIVALADLPAGQVVKFSDKAYYATAPGFGPLLGNGSEGIFSWTIPTGGIGKGTVIMFTLTSGATPSVTTTPSSGTTSVIEGWTSTSATVSPFGQNGDNILIYQGTEASPSFVFGFNNGNNTSIVVNGWNTGLATNPNGACELPSTLTNGTNVIGFNTGNAVDQKDNLKYNGTQTGTKAALLAAICNTNNWINDDVVDYNFTPGTGVFTGTNPIFTLTTGASAAITTAGTLSAFSACSGTASIQQSFTVSGSNLTANIVITPPTGFEVSTTSGSGFTSSVTLTQSSGSVSVTTVYVRLATSASGTPSGNITCTSTGATTQNVAASGTVNALPTITLGSVTNVNTSATSFSLPYSATTGSPNEYSITTGSPTAMPSFSAISNASLPASPISVTIPASAANTYNFVATVRNSTTGCTSSNTNFSVTVVSAGTTINSIVRGTPSAATVNTSSVTYNITFGASVTGLSASNFSLTTSGVSGASIGTLSGSGASYTLTVNTGTGSGDITLNLANSTGLNPTISTSLPFVGETYTIDKTGPTVVAQNVNLYLNAAGTRILTAAQVNNGSSDVSGIQSLSVSPSSFTCANVGTPATVTLTVIDNLGNSNTGTASVTILDTVRPVVNTQNRTVYLNGSGSVTVSALQLNNGTSDACGVASLSSSQTTFTRSNVGANIVTLTGADLNGNTNTGTATVTVIDPFEVTSLILSNGTLSPTFINTTTSYTSSIPNAISSITLTPTLSLGSTTIQIRINGGSYSSVTNGSASGSLPLNVGSNTIELLLTNGLVTPNTTRTFTITVTRDAATPSISTTGTLNAFNSCSGSASSQQSFTVSGSNLTNDIVITPPAGFEVSTTSGSGFSSSVTLTQSSGSVASTTIYTRLTSLASGTPSGNITCSSTGATTRNVAVSGTVNANPTATTSQTNVSCLGGSNGTLTVNVTGGTSPFTYNRGTGSQPSNSFTGLAATSYTVTVTDANGCTATTSAATITQPSSAVSATTSQTNVSCNGGSNGVATVSPSGGTVPYTYMWNNNATTASITGIIAGSYSCVVSDANGCQTTKNYTVTQPSAISATTNQSNVACFGGSNGSLTVSATGGTSPYSYNRGIGNQLSNSFTGLTANTYTVTVTDANGCTATVPTATITQPTALSGSTTQTNVSCNGGSNGSITLTATGGTGTKTYLWSNASTTKDLVGLVFGTYTVTITDANGCTGNTSATITQPAAMSASVSSQTNVACFGASTGELTVSVTGGTSPFSYSRGTGSQSGNSFTGLAATSYTVTVTDANGCTATTSAATITQPASAVSGSTSTSNVSCNGGSNGAVNLTATGGTGTKTYLWSNSATTEDLAGVVAGTYTVTITDVNGCTANTSGTVAQPSPITANTSYTNVSCNTGSNGSASVTASGGNGTLTYAWSTGATTTGITGRVAGTYTVTVTDASTCTTTRTVTITQPSAISASASATNVTCNGGSNGTASVTASGGTGTLTYAWSSGATTASITGKVAGTYTVTITDANGCTANTSATITQPAAMSASVSSQTNVACFGASTGALTVSVTGGTSPFTYNRGTGSQPSNSFTGLATTSYTVTVTDANGCTATTPSATITQPTTAVTATISQTNVSCNGGSNGVATVSPSGGTTPYTYLWNNSATTASISGIIAGSYSCVVSDANGCQTTKNFTVTQPSAISATTNQSNVACNGGSNGSLTVSASGGTSPYSYNRGIGNQLSNSFSGLVANTYTVTVTDANGCTVTAPTATITQPTALSGSTTQTNVSCNGGSNASITLTATGGTGTKTYLWSNASTTKDLAGLVFGTYTVTITDANGCTGNTSATITQPAAMSASVSSQTNVACFGASTGELTISVTGGTSPFSYSRGTGSQSGNSFTGLAATSYTVTVTDANGCTATTLSATITQPATAVSATTSQTNVSCNTGSNGEATVNPTGGTAPYTYLWNNSATTAAITGIIAGSYSCVVSDANGCQTTKNFTVTQPTAISATTNQTNVSCNGGSNGSLTVSASGGTSPYSYNRGIGNQLSNSFSGLVANTYTVTVTDANGCTATVPTATITQPTALSGSTTQTNVSCNGGSNASITLTATGGTGTKTYLWSNASTTKDLAGLVFGTYTVTITDANGCTGNTSATITQPAAMSASVSSQTNVACFGASTGALTVSVTGGTSPFTYNRGTGSQPSNSFTGLAATSYTVTVTDANGCTATTPSATITQPVSALSTTSSQTNVSCNGGSNGVATVSPSGGTTPYTYLWNNSETTASISGIIAGSYSCVVSDANGCQTTKNFTVTQPTAISATTSQTNVSCNAGSNGSASVSASGGTGTLGYLWSNAATTTSISGVVVGTYTVTITDANSCSITKSVTITQPQTLVASQGTVSNVSCFGGSNGSATVNVSGGTTPYSFDWTGTPIGEGTATASGLVIGNYSVNVVDANGCSTSQNFSIFQPASLALNNSTQTNVSCNAGSNGTATIVASGGTAPYSYDWSGTPAGDGTATISGLTAGNYSVLVTDNRSCTATSSFTITEPTVLVTTVGNVLNVSCNGGSDGRINTSTTGGTAPYSYNWTPGNPTGDGTASIVNVPAGAYTLTVQDAKGCISTLNQSITEPTVLVTGFDAQTNVLCNGESTGTAAVIPASGGTAPYTYNWTPGNPQGDGTPIASNLLAGTYNCKITDSKGCFVDVPFTLTENAAITSSQSFSVCFGESVTVGTSIYNQSGTYTNVFEAQNGCDSTVTTNLTVRPLISSIQSFTLCNGQSVTVGSNTYNATGTYTDIFTAIDGCDSVVTTSVLVNPTYNFNQTIQLCFGETLTVGTTTYSASGNYTETMQTINGCDSTINTNLTILPASLSTQDVTLCFGETFSIGDSVCTQSGTYTNVFDDQNGCDSTVTTNLIIRNENIVNQTITLCAGETYSVGNNVYTQTGTYTNFFITDEGCDSTHTLNLIVKSAVIVTTTLTDATIKANLGGSTYQWINCANNQVIAGATNQTYTATVDGDYSVIITYNGCTDTSACVTVENVSLTENPTFTFKLYPNPATSNLTIDASSAIETIELLDLSGKVIQSETANANTHNFNVEALSRGMYLVRFTTNGEVVTRQFVKE